MKRVLSNKWSIMVFVLPTVLFFTYIVIVPIFKSFWYSLLSEIPAKVGDKSEFVWFENYIKMFTPGRRNDFPGAVVNSLNYAGLSIFVQLPIKRGLVYVEFFGQFLYRCAALHDFTF